jgi:hypothetical protein
MPKIGLHRGRVNIKSNEICDHLAFPSNQATAGTVIEPYLRWRNRDAGRIVRKHAGHIEFTQDEKTRGSIIIRHGYVRILERIARN